MRLITILESHYVVDLVIPKSMLEDAGITCFIKNELSAQVLNPMATIMAELQVPKEDVEKALKILNEHES